MLKYFLLLLLLSASAFSGSWLFFGGGSTPSTFVDDYSFNVTATNKNINFGNVLDLPDATTPFSIVFWAKRTGDCEDYSTIAIKWGAPGYQISTGWAGTDNMLTLWFGASNNPTAASEVLPLNTWTHYMVIYTGSGNYSGVSLWYNNVDKTVAHEGVVATPTNTASFLISDSSYGSTQLRIDDFAFIPWALSSDERAEVYNGGVVLDYTTFSGWAAMKASSLAMYLTWEADDLTGTTGSVTDLTDNGRVGTPTNTIAGDKVADAP